MSPPDQAQTPLASLNPVWHANGVLQFDCPVCPKEGGRHIVFIATSAKTHEAGKVWEWNGERAFDKVTVEPSLDFTAHECTFKGWLRRGVVSWF